MKKCFQHEDEHSEQRRKFSILLFTDCGVYSDTNKLKETKTKHLTGRCVNKVNPTEDTDPNSLMSDLSFQEVDDEREVIRPVLLSSLDSCLVRL